MNNKPGFIPIIIAIVVAAVLVGGVTYGVTNSKRNKVIKDQELKIDQLSQDLEDLKTQISAEALSLPEEIKETPSTPSVPSTPSSPSKPTIPAAKPSTPIAPAPQPAPSTPAPSNMKTWSGKILNYTNDENKEYPLSFQYPENLELTYWRPNYAQKDSKTSITLSNKITIGTRSDTSESNAPLTPENVERIVNHADISVRPQLGGKYRRIDASGVKMMTVDTRQAAQVKIGPVSDMGDKRTATPESITTYI